MEVFKEEFAELASEFHGFVRNEDIVDIARSVDYQQLIHENQESAMYEDYQADMAKDMRYAASDGDSAIHDLFERG